MGDKAHDLLWQWSLPILRFVFVTKSTRLVMHPGTVSLIKLLAHIAVEDYLAECAVMANKVKKATDGMTNPERETHASERTQENR